MTRNLVLRGGPGHHFGATTAALVELGRELGVESTVVDDPTLAVRSLRASLDGEGERVDVLTVNALRWRMDQPRYASEREAFAHRLGPDEAATLAEHVRRGGALLALHTAVICFDAHPTWRELCGAAWDWQRSSHPPEGPCAIRVTDAGRRHPVTAGLEDFVIEDEVYGDLDEVDGLVPLLTGAHGGRAHPVVWARDVGAGRVVTDLLGHGPASFAHPEHRRVLMGALTWATAGDRGAAARGEVG